MNGNNQFNNGQPPMPPPRPPQPFNMMNNNNNNNNNNNFHNNNNNNNGPNINNNMMNNMMNTTHNNNNNNNFNMGMPMNNGPMNNGPNFNNNMNNMMNYSNNNNINNMMNNNNNNNNNMMMNANNNFPPPNGFNNNFNPNGTFNAPIPPPQTLQPPVALDPTMLMGRDFANMATLPMMMPPPPPPPIGGLLPAMISQPPMMNTGGHNQQPPLPPQSRHPAHSTTSIDLNAMEELKQQREREERKKEKQRLMDQQNQEKQQREQRQKEQNEKMEREKQEKENKIAELKLARQKADEDRKAKIEALKAQKLAKQNGTTTTIPTPQSTNLPTPGSTTATTTTTASTNTHPSSSSSLTLSPFGSTAPSNNDDSQKEAQFTHLSQTERERVFLRLLSSKLTSLLDNNALVSGHNRSGNSSRSGNNNKTMSLGNEKINTTGIEWIDILPQVVTQTDYHAVSQPHRRKELFMLLVTAISKNGNGNGYDITGHLCVEDEKIKAAFIAIESKLADYTFALPQSVSISLSNAQDNKNTGDRHIIYLTDQQDVQQPQQQPPTIPSPYPNTTTPQFPWLVDSLYYNYMQNYKPPQPRRKRSEGADDQKNTTPTTRSCPFCSIVHTMAQQAKEKSLLLRTNSNTVTTHISDKITSNGRLLCPYHHHLNQSNTLSSPTISNTLSFLPTTAFLPKPDTIFHSLEIQLTYQSHVRSFIHSLIFSSMLRMLSLFSGLCFTRQDLSLFHIVGSRFPSGGLSSSASSQSHRHTSSTLNTPGNTHLAPEPKRRHYIVSSAIGPRSVTIDASTTYVSGNEIGNMNKSRDGKHNANHTNGSDSTVISRSDYEIFISSTCPSGVQMLDNLGYTDGAMLKYDVPALNTIAVMLQFQRQFVSLSNHYYSPSTTLKSDDAAKQAFKASDNLFEVVINSLNQHQSHFKSLLYPYLFPQPQTLKDIKKQASLSQCNHANNNNNCDSCLTCQQWDANITPKDTTAMSDNTTPPPPPFFPPLLTQLLLTGTNANLPIESAEVRNNVINTIITMPFFDSFSQQICPVFSLDTFLNSSNGPNYITSRATGLYSNQIGSNNSLSENEYNDTVFKLNPGQILMTQVLQYLLPFLQSKLSFYIESFTMIRSVFSSISTRGDKLKMLIHDRMLVLQRINSKMANPLAFPRFVGNSSAPSRDHHEPKKDKPDLLLDDYDDDNDNDENNTHSTSGKDNGLDDENLIDRTNHPLNATGVRHFAIYVLESLIDQTLTQIVANTTDKANTIADILCNKDNDGLPMSIDSNGIGKCLDYAKNLHEKNNSLLFRHPSSTNNDQAIPSTYISQHDNYFQHPHRLFQSLPVLDVYRRVIPVETQHNGMTSSIITTPPDFVKNPLFSQPSSLSSFISKRTSLFFEGNEYRNIVSSDEDLLVNSYSHQLTTLPPFFPLSFLLFPPTFDSSGLPLGGNNNDNKMVQQLNHLKLLHKPLPHSTPDNNNNNQSHEVDLLLQDVITNGPCATYYCPCLRPLCHLIDSKSQQGITAQPTVEPHALCLFQFLNGFNSFSYHDYQSLRLSLNDVNPIANDANKDLPIITYPPIKLHPHPVTSSLPSPSATNVFQLAPPHDLTGYSPLFVPMTDPNVYFNDAHTSGNSTHYFYPPVPTELTSPSSSSSPSSQQQSSSPWLTPNRNNIATFTPTMNAIAFLLEFMLDVVNGVVKQQIDTVREIYDPIYFNLLKSTTTVTTTMTGGASTADEQRHQRYNFLTLFQEIHNKIIQQRQAILFPSHDPLSLSSPQLTLSSLANDDNNNDIVKGSVPTPPPLLSTKANSLITSPHLTRELFFYHCIKRDVGMVKNQQGLSNERDNISNFFSRCRERFTPSFLQTKIQSYLLSHPIPLPTPTNSVSSSSSQSVNTMAMNQPPVMSSTITTGDHTTPAITTITIPIDAIMTMTDAIHTIYPDLPLPPVCTCPRSGGLVAEENVKGNAPEETAPSLLINQPHQCNRCLNGYSSQTRHYFFGNLVYQLFSQVGPM